MNPQAHHDDIRDRAGAGLGVGSLSNTVEVAVLVGSVLAFQCLNVALNYIPTLGENDSERRFRWRNIVTSFVHAVISGFSASYCLYVSPELIEDIKHHVTTMAEVLTAISAGYFVYDLVDMYMNRPIRRIWPLATHHIVVIICFSITLCLRTYIAYAVVSLFAETNSVFLHLRQILLIMGMPKTALTYRLNGVVNVITYIFCRFGTLLWMFHWLQVHHYEVPLVLDCIASLGLSTMVVINAVLFKRLIFSDYLTATDKLKTDKNVLEK